MKKKTRATASRAAKRPKSAASGRKAAPRRASDAGIPAAGCVQRRQGDDSPAEGATGPDAGADRGTAGLRRYRLPAGHSEPARLRARAPSRDRLHQALSRRRRADRARRRSPEADQRRFRTRRGRPGAQGHRRDAARAGARFRRGRPARRRRVRAAVVESQRDRRQGQGGHAGGSDRSPHLRFRWPHHYRGRLRGRRDSRYPLRSGPRAGSGRQRHVCAQGAAAARGDREAYRHCEQMCRAPRRSIAATAR